MNSTGTASGPTARPSLHDARASTKEQIHSYSEAWESTRMKSWMTLLTSSRASSKSMVRVKPEKTHRNSGTLPRP